MELPDGYTALELVPLCSAKILVSGTHTLEGTPQGRSANETRASAAYI